MVEPMMKKGEKEDSKERKSLATRGITEKTAGKQLDQRFRKAKVHLPGSCATFSIQERSFKVLTNNITSSKFISLQMYLQNKTYSSSVTVKKGGECCCLNIMVFLELNLKKNFFFFLTGQGFAPLKLH